MRSIFYSSFHFIYFIRLFLHLWYATNKYKKFRHLGLRDINNLITTSQKCRASNNEIWLDLILVNPITILSEA